MNNKQKINLLEKAKTLPKSSGCYLMKDLQQNVIYIGKAKNLKNRVTSYFNDSAKSPKTHILISRIIDFDFVLTENEAESLVLENNLIKEYAPKYNIRLKDDKTYPYVQINLKHPYPRLEYVRRPKRGSQKILLGPYPVGSNIVQVMRVLTKTFKLRDCNDYEFKNRKTPCLLYQMKQCSAPCVDYIDESEYQQLLNKAISFLKGQKKAQTLLKDFTEQMHIFSQQENFEAAIVLRDNISLLQEFLEQSYRQNVEINDAQNTDIIGFFHGSTETDMSLYMIRDGRMIGHKNFHFHGDFDPEESRDQLLSYLLQYYEKTQESPPEKIVTNFDIAQNKLLQSALVSLQTHFRKIKVVSVTPQYQSLWEATTQHAKESQRVRLQNQESPYIGLNKLKELLQLSEIPRLLECYDVAIWQGRSPTAAQIVYHDGISDKSLYRYYHLQERDEGNNDFAMMQEVVERRLKAGRLPDVMIIDGGKAQVNSVLKVLRKYNIDLPVIGIAKAKNVVGHQAYLKGGNHKSQERLIIPGRSNPYVLSRSPSLLRILVQMRDEAHRFSRKLHHKQEKKRVLTSWVDQITGLGARKKQIILTKLDQSEEVLKKMKFQELQDYLNLSKNDTQKVFDYLKSEI